VNRLEEMSKRRAQAHAELISLDSAVYRAFLELERAAFEDGALTEATKHLIAVGISVAIDCESCMQWHIEQAAKAAASKQAIMEAVEVGMEMGGGPATVSARFALDVLRGVNERY
jgi:AhpD family alkylhydroperoxidase